MLLFMYSGLFALDLGFVESQLAHNGRRAQQRQSSLWLQRGCMEQGLLLLNESCSPAPLPKAQKQQLSWESWWEVIDGRAVLALQEISLANKSKNNYGHC